MAQTKQQKYTPYSDEWWLDRLVTKRGTRPTRPTGTVKVDSRRYDYRAREWQDYLFAYYMGEPPTATINDRWSDATKEFLRLSKNNYPALIVEAVADRLHFQGVRAVDDASDYDGDDTVRKFLAVNGAFVQDAFESALTVGVGYIFVGPPTAFSKYAVATAEDPRQIEVITDPLSNQVLAAMKTYFDGENTVLALYVAADGKNESTDRYATYTMPGQSWSGFDFKKENWTADPERTGPLTPAGLGVPIVPIYNRRLMGEFEQHLDLIDRITNDISDRLWTVKYQAFKQRVIKGDLPDRDENGEEIDYDSLFEADPGAVWRLGQDDDIWESGQVMVQDILLPYDKDVKELSAVTRTPLHMFTPDAISGSAAGADLASDGAISKAHDRILRWSPAMVRVAQLGLAYSGQPSDQELQAMWGPVENLSIAEKGQAASQLNTIVPKVAIWSDVMKEDAATVARWKALEQDQAMQDAINNAISAAATAAPAQQAGPVGAAASATQTATGGSFSAEQKKPLPGHMQATQFSKGQSGNPTGAAKDGTLPNPPKQTGVNNGG